MKTRNAVVTGASSGIGYEIAKTLLRDGFNILICSRTLADLVSAKERLQRLSTERQVYIHVTDVSIIKQVVTLADFARKIFSQVDILVNNAGVIGPIGLFSKNDLKLWIETININLIGSVLVTHAFLPLMPSSARGKIIQIASSSASAPDPRFSAYAASKAGIARFVETIAVELAPIGIDVNAILPGAISTRFNENRINVGIENAGQAAWHASVLRKEIGGDSIEECSNLLSFLASEESDGLTGKIISAQRDDWKSFKGRITEIQKSEKYTIRRQTK